MAPREPHPDLQEIGNLHVRLRLIMNPASRSGRGRRRWAAWEAGLRCANVDWECAVTEGPGDAFRISRECRAGEVIAAVGGDGTINEVLDGIVQSGSPDVRMGVLYSGTSPDFCRFHGIPLETQHALDTLLAGAARAVDVVRIQYSDETGARRLSHFGCGCNIGLGAAVARYSNRVRGRLGDGLGTGLAVLRAVMRSAPADLDLEVDGQPQNLAQVNNLSILKNPHIASGLKLDLDITPDDGTVCLVAVHGRSRVGVCTLLPGFYTGRAASSGRVLVRKCSRVGIRSRREQEIEFDGDPRGYLPADLRVLPKALHLIAGSHE